MGDANQDVRAEMKNRKKKNQQKLSKRVNERERNNTQTFPRFAVDVTLSPTRIFTKKKSARRGAEKFSSFFSLIHTIPLFYFFHPSHSHAPSSPSSTHTTIRTSPSNPHPTHINTSTMSDSGDSSDSEVYVPRDPVVPGNFFSPLFVLSFLCSRLLFLLSGGSEIFPFPFCSLHEIIKNNKPSIPTPIVTPHHYAHVGRVNDINNQPTNLPSTLPDSHAILAPVSGPRARKQVERYAAERATEKEEKKIVIPQVRKKFIQNRFFKSCRLPLPLSLASFFVVSNHHFQFSHSHTLHVFCSLCLGAIHTSYRLSWMHGCMAIIIPNPFIASIILYVS